MDAAAFALVASGVSSAETARVWVGVAKRSVGQWVRSARSGAAISTRSSCRGTIALVPFKYLLVLPDGEPPDPAAFVTAIPNWGVGEEFMVAGLKRFRILDINDEIDADGLERGINGIWMVEPVT